MPRKFTPEDIAKAHSPEAIQKRRETFEYISDLQAQGILNLWRERRMVPIAIADHVGVTVERVAEVLREAGEEIPGYLTVTGGKSSARRRELLSELRRLER